MAAVDLSLSGLASGLDWKTLVEQLAQAERTPQVRLRNEQSTLAQQNSAYATIATQMGSLQSRITDITSGSLFDSRLTNSSDATKSTATANAGAALGSYVFNVTQLAAAAKQVGASGVGKSLSATNDVSGLLVTSAPFATAVTPGTFTVNGVQITIAATDTLQNVFDNIQAATGSAVAGSYDAASDRITLTGVGPVIVGSATDSSNFLQVAKLHNSGGNSVSSSSALGVITQTSSLTKANFATALTNGAAGEFKINGVSITYAATDTVANVLKRINDSGAGVSASYDTVNDRFVVSNKTTGDIGIAFEDVSGNFLAAAGISGGTLSRGQNLLYTIDGGGQLVSQSNTISDASSGLTGLAVTALTTGASTISVASDTAKIKTAITDFISEYNKVQSVLDSQTASTTDAQGKVSAGILANETEANEITSQLRRMITGQIPGLGSALNQLEDLGIVSNGKDNSLTLSSETKLDDALNNSFVAVKSIFTDPANGLAKVLGTYLDKTIGDSGTLVVKQANLTQQSSTIDTQVADLERIVQADKERMTANFVAMETAQSTIKQQLAYLTKQFGTSTTG